MSSSDLKYCNQWITERGVYCSRQTPLSNKMCDECFGRRAAAYTALDPPSKHGASDTAASSDHKRQIPHNTKKNPKTNSGPRAHVEDVRSSSHRKMTNGDKRSSGRQTSQASVQTQAPTKHSSKSSKYRQ